MVLGALAAAVVAALLATALRPRLGTASAVSVAGLLVVARRDRARDPRPTRPRRRDRAAERRSEGVLVGLRRPVGRGVRGPRVRPADPQRAALRAGGHLPRAGGRRWWSGLVLAPVGLVALAAYSLAIELTQLQLARLDRACDVTDVVDNVLGAGIGFAIGLLCSRSSGRGGAGSDRSSPSLTRVRVMPSDPCVPAAPAQRARHPCVRRRQAARRPTRADVVQALLQREPLPAAARRARRRPRGGGGDEPLPRHGQRRALRRPGRHDGRAGRGPRRRDRLGRADLPARQRLLRARRRGRLRLALLRGLPDRGHRRRRRAACRCRSRPTAATTSTRWPRRSPTAPGSSSSARPTTRPARPSRSPSSTRSSRRCPRTWWSWSTRPTSSSCGWTTPSTGSPPTAATATSC